MSCMIILYLLPCTAYAWTPQLSIRPWVSLSLSPSLPLSLFILLSNVAHHLVLSTLKAPRSLQSTLFLTPAAKFLSTRTRTSLHSWGREKGQQLSHTPGNSPWGRKKPLLRLAELIHPELVPTLYHLTMHYTVNCDFLHKSYMQSLCANAIIFPIHVPMPTFAFYCTCTCV